MQVFADLKEMGIKDHKTLFSIICMIWEYKYSSEQ